MGVRKLEFYYAEGNHLHYPFSQQKEMVCLDWLASFLKSSNLSLRTSEATSMNRVAVIYSAKINEIFDEELENITFVGTNNSAGTFIPPIMIYSRVRMNLHLLVGSFAEQM